MFANTDRGGCSYMQLKEKRIHLYAFQNKRPITFPLNPVMVDVVLLCDHLVLTLLADS